MISADVLLEDGELLIRLNCTGLCMSDVHFMMVCFDATVRLGILLIFVANAVE